MKVPFQWQRILILIFLFSTFLFPILFLSRRLELSASLDRNAFVQEFSTINQRLDTVHLNSKQEEAIESFKENEKVVYDAEHQFPTDTIDISESRKLGKNAMKAPITHNPHPTVASSETNGTNTKSVKDDQMPHTEINSKDTSRRRDFSIFENSPNVTKQNSNVNLLGMRDQMIRAKAYIYFSPPGSHSGIFKELRQRSKDLEMATSHASKDSDLPESAFHKKKLMEDTLMKVSRIFRDCNVMAKKLRAMSLNAEDELLAENMQVNFLYQVAARTMSKGLHCLSMLLTNAYFSFTPNQRQLPNQHSVHDPSLFHYALFSDNVLASAVTVNSTIYSSKNPDQIVFHIVTDPLNLSAFKAWFMLSYRGTATVEVLSSQKYENLFPGHGFNQTGYLLNLLRFYLPDVFPYLNKIVVLDHDVVVRRDLTEFWSTDLKGKVNGAVETCQNNRLSSSQVIFHANFTEEKSASGSVSIGECKWSFGMNLLDLQTWRAHKLTSLHKKELQSASNIPLQSLRALAWNFFKDQTKVMTKSWLISGLGHNSEITQDELDSGAAFHYNGIMKPWSDIAIARYRSYWSKHVNYANTFLQECNIHDLK